MTRDHLFQESEYLIFVGLFLLKLKKQPPPKLIWYVNWIITEINGSAISWKIAEDHTYRSASNLLHLLLISWSMKINGNYARKAWLPLYFVHTILMSCCCFCCSLSHVIKWYCNNYVKTVWSSIYRDTEVHSHFLLFNNNKILSPAHKISPTTPTLGFGNWIAVCCCCEWAFPPLAFFRGFHRSNLQFAAAAAAFWLVERAFCCTAGCRDPQ